jgi:hypothetical protein
MTGTKKPNLNDEGEKELNKIEKQFDEFNENVKELTLDRMNLCKKEDKKEPEISQRDLEKASDIYLKPKRTISCRDKFNEKFRDAYNYDKEYVQFTAENKELIGEQMQLWTRPYAGMPAEEWEFPANTPVWGPRYLAEQIKRKYYHRLVMKDRATSSDGYAVYTGTMAADTTIQRLDAHPVIKRRSVFMNASGF